MQASLVATWLQEGHSPSCSHVAVRLACTKHTDASYSLIDDAPDDGQVTVRNM